LTAEPRKSASDELLTLDGTAIRGSVTARAGALIFSDFECASCARFAQDVLPHLQAHIDNGNLLVAFRHFFNERSHPRAFRLALAATCAGRQGKFWPMHDRLFTLTRLSDDSVVHALAAATGLDMDLFRDCLAAPTEALVDRDLRTAALLGIDGTPTTFVGEVTAGTHIRTREVIVGVQPLARFEAAIARILRGR
jgi:protein-disulfide isomerase